jgi:hypothetical protein
VVLADNTLGYRIRQVKPLYGVAAMVKRPDAHAISL